MALNAFFVLLLLCTTQLVLTRNNVNCSLRTRRAASQSQFIFSSRRKPIQLEPATLRQRTGEHHNVRDELFFSVRVTRRAAGCSHRTEAREHKIYECMNTYIYAEYTQPHTHTSSAFSIDVRVCTLFCVHIYIYIFVALLWMDASAGAATWDWALPALAQQTRGAHFITQTQSTYDSRPQRLLFQSVSLLSFALRVFRPRVVLIYFPVFAVCVVRAPREVRARTAYHPHIHTCAILKCLIFLMRGIPKRHKHILYRLCRGS